MEKINRFVVRKENNPNGYHYIIKDRKTDDDIVIVSTLFNKDSELLANDILEVVDEFYQNKKCQND